jgi:hypothetical protein
MSVRDFVLMTVALEQQMLLASQRRTDDLMPHVAYPMDTMPLDTNPPPSAATPYPYPPAYPYPSPYPVPYSAPTPLDSARRVDTVYLPMPRDTRPAWRDTVRPRIDPRDTIRHDLPRPRIDSVRDTIRTQRRDTLRPAPPDTSWRPPPPPPPPPPPDSIPTA